MYDVWLYDTWDLWMLWTTAKTCGQDIVCAGVSVLLQTLCYSLEEITKDKVTYSLKEGEGVVGVYHPTCKSLTLAKAFVIGCRDISNRYPDYVQLEIKN